MSVYREGDRWRPAGYDRERKFPTEGDARRAEARWYRDAPKPKRGIAERENTSLYRCYDEHGALLYVGVARSFILRLRQHEGKTWWLDVADVKVEHFASREDALRAEAIAISSEGPAYNVAQNAGAYVRPVSFNAEKRELSQRLAAAEARLRAIQVILDDYVEIENAVAEKSQRKRLKPVPSPAPTEEAA